MHSRLDEDHRTAASERGEPPAGAPHSVEGSQRQLEHSQGEIERRFEQIDERIEQSERQQVELQHHLVEQYQERETGYRHRLAVAEKTCTDLTDRVAACAGRLAELQNRLGVQNSENAALRAALEHWTAFERTRGFRFLRKLHSIRVKLIPEGGRIERTASLGYRALRRSLRLVKAGVRKLSGRASLPSSADGGLQSAAANGQPVRRFTRTPAMIEVLDPVEVRGLVSVVLPVYNHAHMLKGAIDSVLAQTYRNFELIVVNDGSTDEIEPLLAEYAAHPQIRILNQSNQKLPKALTNGFQFARGEFWTWTSADNFMLPEQLTTLVAHLQSHPAAAMVYGDYLAIDERGEPLAEPNFRPQNRYQPGDPAIHLPHSTEPLNVVLDNFIGPCFLYRASAGRLLGDYDPSLGIEDYDYWMRMNMSFAIEHLDSDRPLYKYRVHDDSLSGRATELGIYGRAERLLAYQRERAEFFDRPWTIYADDATAELLKDTELTPHRVLPWSGEAVPHHGDEKRMLLVHCGSLPAVAASKSAAAVIVAAWFDHDAAAPYQYRQEIRRLGAACFSREDTTLDRLGLVTDRRFRFGSAASLVAQLVCYANNRAFMRATRGAEELARAVPLPALPIARRLRVLLQAEQFTQGGLEQVVADLAAQLDRERFDPLLLVLGEQGTAVEQVRGRGIRVLTLPKEGREDAYRKLLIDERIDLVNSHFSIYGGYIAWQNGIPFVQTIHNTYFWLPPEEQGQYRDCDSFTAAYLCVSPLVAQYSDIKIGLSARKMIVVPNGIDLARLEMKSGSFTAEELRADLRLAADDFVFLNVASITPAKVQCELVRAFARVIAACPQAKLVLLGTVLNQDYHAQLVRLIAELDLEPSVILAGHHDNIAAFYEAANAFVLPSYVEGWSLAMNEAVCANLPVIATDVGGAADLLGEVGGKIIPPPFGAITNLTRETFGRHLAACDGQFIENLAEAMKSVCRERPRPQVSAEVRRKLSSKHTYEIYERLFMWFAQGGQPDVARRWLQEDRHSCLSFPGQSPG